MEGFKQTCSLIMKDTKSLTLLRSGDMVLLDDAKNTLGIFHASDLSKLAQKPLIDGRNYLCATFISDIGIIYCALSNGPMVLFQIKDGSVKQTKVIHNQFVVNKFIAYDKEYVLAVGDNGQLLAMNTETNDINLIYKFERIQDPITDISEVSSTGGKRTFMLSTRG